MGTVTAAAAAPEGLLRAAMVDRLRARRLVTNAAVEAAMRAVPRHLFVPSATVQDAYSSGVIVTHRDASGTATSSASAPGVVAGMLEQLDVRPGQRILEIGSGTGYNAALLAWLTGSAGQVMTVEIDKDIACEARRGLAAAGYGDVLVICGDGEAGVPDHAPYDRIIVTAGAWDLPAAWHDQLAPGGRLVVPFRMRGVTRSVAFERAGGYWQSQSIDELGFMPIRGAGAMAERNLRLGDVTLRIDDGQAADERALGEALAYPATLAWTGALLPAGGIGHLDFWLASLDGFCRLLVTSPDAAGRGLVAPVYDWGSMAVYGERCFAYLTVRPPAGTADGARELGVCAYGPGSAELAARVAGRIRAWNRDRQSVTRLWIEVHPAGAGTAPGDLMSIGKRHTRVRVRTA